MIEYERRSEEEIRCDAAEMRYRIAVNRQDMPYDETSEAIRKRLGLDEFENETCPKIVSQLREILESLEDSKFYP